MSSVMKTPELDKIVKAYLRTGRGRERERERERGRKREREREL